MCCPSYVINCSRSTFVWHQTPGNISIYYREYKLPLKEAYILYKAMIYPFWAVVCGVYYGRFVLGLAVLFVLELLFVSVFCSPVKYCDQLDWGREI